MSAFWYNLHRLAQGQLFNGGYIGAGAVTTEAARTPTPCKDAQRDDPNRGLRHVQIAALR
jgi:hypothetical protein